MSSIALVRGDPADTGSVPGNPNVPHPGAPETAVAARQDTQAGEEGAASATYNNGLYTPWEPTDQASETAAASTPTAVVATSDDSVYLQPTESAADNNIPSTTISSPEAVASQTAETVVSTSPTTAIPTTPPPASTSPTTSQSTLSTSSTVSSSSSAATTSTSNTSQSSQSLSSGILDSARQTANSQASSNDTKIGVILPVALSLGALALILAGISFVVWRRRVSRRRHLERRRYDEAFVEKGSTYDRPDDFDDYDDHGVRDEKLPQWQDFNGYSEAYDAPLDSGMAGAGVRNIPGAGQGSGSDPFRPRESRRPLPSAPVQEHPSMPTVVSTDYDLDAMMAQSRTGHTPYQARPERSRSVVSNIASSVYSSLSLRSKKSRNGRQIEQGQAGRQWNEHGSWTQLNDPHEEGSEQRAAERSFPAGGAANRPLLSAVDGTPKKAGTYRNAAPQESPTKSPEYRPYAVQHSVAPARGYILHDNPVPSYYSPAAPKRQKSTATQRSERAPDTPSVYSTTTCEPMSAASPISAYPSTLQPGQSPALGKSPILPSQIVANRRLQRQQSGTTYSLGGMAGLLYNEQPDRSQAQSTSYTSIPPRKPRKQSVLARYKPQGAESPLSDEATAGEGEASPHRAISAVVRASRARGGSADGHSFDGHSGGPWSTGASRGLGESQASRDSIDNLLTNVLGPARSPA